MTFFLLALAAGIALFILFGVLRRKPVVTATIAIRPSGESSVTFEPSDPAPDSLIRLLLCYGAKIRWVLNTEPPESAEAFEDFCRDALTDWAVVDVNNLIADMSSAAAFLNAIDGAPSTVPAGEQFTVHLHVSRNGAYVTNCFPTPGLAGNAVWNYVLLLEEVRSRLSQQQREESALALQAWWHSVFSELGQDASIRGLHRLTDASNKAYSQVNWTAP
jgi:hypothetical protein